LNIPLCSVYLSPHAWQEDQDHAPKAADCCLGFFPAWFGPPPGGLRLAGFPLPDDASLPALPEALAEFLQSGSPPIIFTPGSFVRHAESFFRESLAACERLNARAVFLTPHREQVPAILPPTAIHFKYVALQRLAPKAAALVHHGGIGTCVQAMKAGIAQLIVPVFFDQFDNAARVESLATGKSILPSQYDGNAAAQQLHHLLHSGAVKRDCFRISTEFQVQNPVVEICDILEAMA
jgi:rhamnosyltransferase subunit B